MKTKTKWLIGAAVLTLAVGGYAMKELVFGFGEVPMSKKKELTKEEKQLAYLKEHEQDIIDFVKAQNPKIESVQIDWEDVRRGRVSNPFSDEEYVRLYGTFNHIENSGWGVIIYTENGELNIETIEMGNHLRIGGDYFE